MFGDETRIQNGSLALPEAPPIANVQFSDTEIAAKGYFGIETMLCSQLWLAYGVQVVLER